jgi:hypothetical protein
VIDDVVDALAVARLVIEDRVPFGKLRDAMKQTAWRNYPNNAEKEEPYVVELLSCPWCASIWVALFVLLVRRLPGWKYLARVLAASEIAGLASTYVER